MTTFFPSANSTADRRAGVSREVIETLMTWAPSVAAARIPSARSRLLPVSSAFTLTERIRAAGATPSNGMPWAWRSLAAMIAATAVPCPTQSASPVLVRSMAVTRPASCLL